MESGGNSKEDLGRFELPIGILAIVLYVIERVLAFSFLQNRAAAGAGLESQFLEFFFGNPPCSILDILLGFDLPAGWLGILNPKNILQAGLQVVHFLANWWIVTLPIIFYLKSVNRKKEY